MKSIVWVYSDIVSETMPYPRWDEDLNDSVAKVSTDTASLQNPVK